MAGSGASAGHDTRVNYKWEDNGFNADPNDTAPKVPGSNTRLTSAEGSNEIRKVFMPGQREAIEQIITLFEGRFAFQFYPTNPWWIRTLLGSPNSTDNGDGSHTHSYTGADPESFQIIEGYEEAMAERTLSGCVTTRVSIDVNVGEPVQVTVEGVYAEENVDKELSDLTAQEMPQHDTFTYAEGALSIGGSTEGYVQSMSVTVEANIRLIREMGSTIAIDFNDRQLVPSFNFGEIKHGTTEDLEDLYGGATTIQEDRDNEASVTMTLDNAASAGSGINQQEWQIGGTMPESYGESGVGDPTADLEQTINRAARTVDAVATNETATPP